MRTPAVPEVKKLEMESGPTAGACGAGGTGCWRRRRPGGDVEQEKTCSEEQITLLARRLGGLKNEDGQARRWIAREDAENAAALEKELAEPEERYAAACIPE